MPSDSLDHMIYAPVPFKGYAIRAKSPAVVEEEFKEAARDWFVPFDETLYADYSYQSRVVINPFSSKKLFFSRTFRRPKLDDLGRDGQVCHMVSISKDLLSQGLSLKDVDESLASFEDKTGIPVGSMESLGVSWDGDEDRDLDGMNSIVPEDSAKKLIAFFSGKDGGSDTKVLVVFKRSYRERIGLCVMLGKFLYKLDLLPSFTVTSDPPMEVILNTYSNIVLSEYVPHLKPNSNWKVLNLTPSGDTDARINVNQNKIDDTMKTIYGSTGQ